jgi:hypothetical protein
MTDETKDPVYQEGYNAGIVQGMKLQAQRQADENAMYISGWNSGIEMAITKMQSLNKAFGADTLNSFAVWFRSVKK